ncbi:hypothetical protein [Paenarthrobacter sp. YJN-5]
MDADGDGMACEKPK